MRNIAEAFSQNGLPLDIGGRIFDFLPLGKASRNRSINRYFRKAGDLAIVSKLGRIGIRRRSAREMLADAIQYRTEAEQIRKKLRFRLLGLGTGSLSTRDFKFLPLAKTVRHLGQYLKTTLTGCVDIESFTYRPTMIIHHPSATNRRPIHRSVGVNVTMIGLVYEVPVAQYLTELQLLRDAFRPEDYPRAIYGSFRHTLDHLITIAQEKRAARESHMNVTFVPILSRQSQEGTLYQTLKDDLSEPLLERYGTYLSGIGGTKGPSIALELKQSRFSVRLSPNRYEVLTEFSLDTIEEHLADQDKRLKEHL